MTEAHIIPIESRTKQEDAYYRMLSIALLGISHMKDEKLYPKSLRKTVSVKRLMENPEELSTASHYLSRWPITTDESTMALARYHAERHPRSISDKKGVIEDFENGFNQALSLNRKYTLSIGSGTAGLWNAYQALGVQPGTRVAVPSYTFHATNSPLVDLGAIPVMMDARPDNGNVTPEIVQKTLEDNKDIKVVTVTHMWGIPVEGMEEITDITKHHNASLLEDCSHAHGALIEGKSVGTFGDIAVFSCQDNKGVSIGEGGIIVTDDVILHKRLLSKTHYRRKESEIRGIGEGDEYDLYIEEGTGGIKSRLHPFAAVEGLSQLTMFDEVLRTRREYANKLHTHIITIPWLRMPHIPKRAIPSWYGMRIDYIPENNGGKPIEVYAEAMQERGLDIHVGTSMLVSEQNLFQTDPPNYKYTMGERTVYNKGDFPGAEEFCRNKLVLPVFSVADQELINAVVSAYGEIMAGKI